METSIRERRNSLYIVCVDGPNGPNLIGPNNLDKICAEAPLQIMNPCLHSKHPLILQQSSKASRCRICSTRCEGFLYHCSDCGIHLDMNCVNLLPRDSSGNFIEISHDVHNHPLVSIGNEFRIYCDKCSPSSKLMDASYACFDRELYLHEKCPDLSLEICHPYHREHHLILEFVGEPSLCDLCHYYDRGLFYFYRLCGIAIHSDCDGLPPTIEDKRHHEHPFTLFLRPDWFNCDVCGKRGSGISYICPACNILVHKECISLPCFIRISLHHHSLSRVFFLPTYQDDYRDCRICYKRVASKHGCYCCPKPDCSFITHVMCAIESGDLYGLVELESQDEIDDSHEFSKEAVNPIIRVIREIKDGDDTIAAEVLHFSHEHNLTLTDESIGNKLCDGCILPILSSFYYCSQCDFFLHRACAALPRKTRLWFRASPFTLHTKGVFKCSVCEYECSGFSYISDDCDIILCLRYAALPHSLTYQAHKEHFLFFDHSFEGPCDACDRNDESVKYRSKNAQFALDWRGLTLPTIVWHKCDKHPMKLTCGDYNDYPLHHYCDICENKRNPRLWFYQCEVCNTTVHTKCALGDYPFVKRGMTFKSKDHSHSLSFVQKIYYYPLCIKCKKPCQDLAFECVEPGCNFIAHGECITLTPFDTE